MTQPSTDRNAPLPWETALRDVLGAENNYSIANIASPTDPNRPTWISLNSWFTATQEGIYARPWDHWMPQGVGGANDITIYRKRYYSSEEFNYENFQLVRGTVWFYDGGDASPATQGQRFVSAAEAVINSIGSNKFLDRTTYQTAQELFYNTWWWLNESAARTLRNLVERVAEDGSNFDGTAADALVWAMQVMEAGTKMLAQNIEGDGDAARNWSIALRQNAEAIDTFKSEMSAAWAELKGANRYYDPNWLVRDVLLEIERQVDTTDAQTHWHGAGNQNEAWNFSFPNQGLSGTYNLLNPEGWAVLDRDMKAAWRQHIDRLDQRSIEATRKLIASFDHTWTVMARAIPPFADVPYHGPKPDSNSSGGGGPNDLPNINKGSGGGGDLPNLNQGNGGGGGSGGSNLPNLNSGNGGSGLPNLNSGNGGSGLPNLNSGNGGSGLPGLGGLGSSSSSGSGLPGLGGLGGINPPDTGNRSSGGVVTPPLTRASGGSGATLPPPRKLTPEEVAGLGRRPQGAGGSGLREPQEVRKSGMTLGPLGVPPSAYADLSQLAGAGTPTLVAGGASPGGSSANIGVAGANGADGGLGTKDGLGANGGPGAGGMGGMPFMPPMGGMGAPGGNQEKERERKTWLAEEEDVWGTDPDCSPAVVGRDESAEPNDKPVRPTTRPATTNEPARTQSHRRTGS